MSGERVYCSGVYADRVADAEVSLEDVSYAINFVDGFDCHRMKGKEIGV